MCRISARHGKIRLTPSHPSPLGHKFRFSNPRRKRSSLCFDSAVSVFPSRTFPGWRSGGRSLCCEGSKKRPPFNHELCHVRRRRRRMRVSVCSAHREVQDGPVRSRLGAECATVKSGSPVETPCSHWEREGRVCSVGRSRRLLYVSLPLSFLVVVVVGRGGVLSERATT